MVNLEVIDVLETPTYGSRSAQVLCEKLGIKTQNDRTLLDQAK